MKRYNIWIHCVDDMPEESPKGEWVKWEDVEAVLAERNEAQAKLAAANALLDRAVDEIECDIYSDPVTIELVDDIKKARS